jgi:D-glycero-D-manno-heptose 1,7-bisphosphate phosphatase
MTRARAVFLDRDGVLIHTPVRDGVPRPPDDVGGVEVLPGVAAALGRLGELGLLRVVVTNQPDVARGRQTLAGVEAIHLRLRETLSMDDVLVCPHDTPDGCACRKPRPGMLLAAAARHGIDLAGSFLVGDRWSDVEAGGAAGCRTVLIARDYSGRERCRPDAVADDLPAAVEVIAHWLGTDT